MRIAAIDVGTNSIHMIVCRIRPDLSFEVIDREKDMVRLGAGSLGGRDLPPSSTGVAMQTLSKFKRLADSHGVDEIIAAATSAVREAANGAKFIAYLDFKNLLNMINNNYGLVDAVDFPLTAPIVDVSIDPVTNKYRYSNFRPPVSVLSSTGGGASSANRSQWQIKAGVRFKF